MSTTPETNRTTHTPGPWKWFDYQDGRKILVAPERAVIHCPDAPMEVDPPDAQLIASAPDLRVALAYMLNCFDAESTDVFLTLDPVGAIAQARAAIAKAEGR